MKTKFVVPVVVSALLVLLVSVGSAFAGWHDLTQAQRNQAIVNEARSYTTGTFGDTCKKWVQLYVVPGASGDEVLLPTNNGTCTWNQDNDYLYVVGRSALLDYVVSGEIIQMTLNSDYNYKPHTIVITANDGSNISFRESNWCNKCYLINAERTLSYDDFYDMVVCYSVYYIL